MNQKTNGQLLEERDLAWQKHREAIAEECREKQEQLERQYRMALAAERARVWRHRVVPWLHAVLFSVSFCLWQGGSYLAGLTAYLFLVALASVLRSATTTGRK